MKIDTTFNFYSDATGQDPDSSSPTLKLYHRTLWSKQLPNGVNFQLKDGERGAYLYHHSELGVFYLGSDAITHSYKHHKRKQFIIKQVTDKVDELFDAGSTIGAYIVFPNNKINGKHTINQARGVSGLIDDRFDLTLECIRRYYLHETSPLYETLERYKDFFNLFNDFSGYVSFFFLDDLVDSNGEIRFYLPFDNFNSKPLFGGVEDYLNYREKVLQFIKARNERINNWQLLHMS